MTKIEYDDDKWMKQEIDLTEELVSSFDGRCFWDLDMYSDRIEAFRFTKTTTGIDTLYIGCEEKWGYVDNLHDDYGKHKYEDTYCGTELLMIREGNGLIREISQDVFDKINKLVAETIKKWKERENAFKKRVKEIDLMNNSAELKKDEVENSKESI